MNLPCIISFDLSQIQAGKTPFLANSNDKVSCTSLLDAIGKTLVHPKSVAYACAHLLPLLESKKRDMQAMIMKIPIICSESS